MRQRLFESATLKLTGWYLLVLAIISLMFSIVLYQVSIAEVERRLERYQEQSQMLYHPPPQDNLSSPDTIRNKELISAIWIKEPYTFFRPNNNDEMERMTKLMIFNYTPSNLSINFSRP